MKAGDFVKVDYVGRIKGTDEIFDLTKEDVAKKENIQNPNAKYKPVVLILGSGFLIKGLDEELQKMKVGEAKKIEIPPDKAFGDKKEEMVKLLPEAKFKEQNLSPFPGAVVNIGNMKGKIISVDGGRIKVDFNHPLAGKTLEYDIEILEAVENVDEKIKSAFSYFTAMDEIEVKTKGKEAEILVKKDVDIVRPVKKMIAETIIKWCGVEKVKISEVFEKQEDSEPEK